MASFFSGPWGSDESEMTDRSDKFLLGERERALTLRLNVSPQNIDNVKYNL